VSVNPEGGTDMYTDDDYREAFHFLDQHAIELARILDALESPYEEECEEAINDFRDYPMGLTLWNTNVYRIYLSGGLASEHLDLHIDRELNPRKLTYHLEFLGGSADLVVDFESPVYLYAVMLLDAFGGTTY
jgi:hypothetical protein